jgi:hypothetical protein
MVLMLDLLAQEPEPEPELELEPEPAPELVQHPGDLELVRYFVVLEALRQLLFDVRGIAFHDEAWVWVIEPPVLDQHPRVCSTELYCIL